MEFTMEIAGHAAQVQSLFTSTQVYFRNYLTVKPPEYTITVTPEALVREQAFLNAEADSEGLRRRTFTDAFLERTVIQRETARFLLTRGILFLHGSTVSVDNRAYLFTARCGVGKSTHTRLWREVFGQRAVMVNDDRAFLRMDSGCVTAFGSPWSGKHGLDTNIAVPLAGICILQRGQENVIHPLSEADALPFLTTQVYLPEDAAAQQAEALTRQLCRQVPLWTLSCTREQDAARIAYAAMSSQNT